MVRKRYHIVDLQQKHVGMLHTDVIQRTFMARPCGVGPFYVVHLFVGTSLTQSLHHPLSYLLHVTQILQILKRTRHAQKLEHRFLLPLHTDNEISPARFLFVYLHMGVTDPLGEVFGDPVRPSFEHGSLFASFDRDKLPA